MIKNLIKLNEYLDSFGYKENDMLSIIIKKAYINDAHIVIVDGNKHCYFYLYGKIDNNYYDFGCCYVIKLRNASSDDYPDKSFWHIHSSISSTYIGLGYGKDLYLAAIKYATESNAFIISGSINTTMVSPEALSLHQRLIQIPGLFSKKVLITQEIISENIKIENLTDENSYKLNRFQGDLINAQKNAIKFGEHYISTGHIYEAKGGLPISIPVKVEEDVYDVLSKHRETYESTFDDSQWNEYAERLKELQSPYDLRKEKIRNIRTQYN